MSNVDNPYPVGTVLFGEKHLIPYFKDSDIRTISKIVLKEFRTSLTAKNGRKGEKISNKRINNIMAVLRLIVNEAYDEINLPSPFDKIEPLAIVKKEINPFSPAEVRKFLNGVRQDFRNYYQTRFFTGMRTAEIDGLKWQYVDFDNKKIGFIRKKVEMRIEVQGEERR